MKVIFMLTKDVYEKYKTKTIEFLKKANIVITDEEKDKIQVAEYNLGCVDKIGLELVEYVNTDRCCAKQLVLLPYQTCPEHKHPPVFGKPGKEETFRCCFGEVYLYVQGEPTKNIRAKIPEGFGEYFTCRHEIILNPGEQYTITPDTLHWFQAGEEGAAVLEFSTTSRDDYDIYTDPKINPSESRRV